MAGRPSERRRAWWQRKRFVIPAGLFAVLMLIGALSDNGRGDRHGAATNASSQRVRAQTTTAARSTATPTATATAKPASVAADAARATARRLRRGGEYREAVAVLAAAGLVADAGRVRRAAQAKLNRSAREALATGHLVAARSFALRSRRLRSTADARSLVHAAAAAIAAAADRRTCTNAEKHTVRAGKAVPAGCARYAARRKAAATARCDSNYAGACLKPDAVDYDCAGGSGDGPDYTGPVRIVGDDHYDLDRDGDGYACES